MRAIGVAASNWWHNPALPTADEWQAIAAMLTLLVAAIGIYFTFGQVKLSREANERAAEANERAAEANERAALSDARAAAAAEAEARPYVSVTFELEALPSANPKEETADGLAFIVIESFGRTPARNITLHAAPPFESSGRGRPPGRDPVMETLTKVFSEGFTIGMLAPGQRLRYLLDMGREAVDPKSGRPNQYTVTINYWNAELTREYRDEVVIHIEPWAMTIMQVNPLDTIARQIRRISEKGYK